ncbi:MAG: serpin family protein [Cyanobacteria bacterium P01_A01_bin.84]
MKPKLNSSQRNFLQRRYGVCLGRRYTLAAAGVVLMGVLGCSHVNSSSSAMGKSIHPRNSPSSLVNSELTDPRLQNNPEQKIVTANTKFGFNLFTEVTKQEGEKNIFISPNSIATALAMIYGGASGSTKKAMAKVLEVEGIKLSEIHSAYGGLKNLLVNPDNQVKLAIANSLWADKDSSFNPEFIENSKKFFQAEVTNLNFQQPDAVDVINKWVKDNTQNRINKVIDRIDPDQAMLLINAIYFKGSWSKEFNRNNTTDSPFYLTSGKQKQHPMMSQKGDYKYYENEKFQGISLPYGDNGRVSFYVFLPKSDSSLQKFANSLNSQNWEKWMSNFRKQEGSIKLPRFKIDYDVNLNNSLKTLGMGEAFTKQANFSQLGENLTISQVKHKTFVEVNEEGTEAAGTTSVGVVPTSLPVNQPFEMNVNRPFFFAIRDNQTGSILFMGSIVEPKV